MPRDKEELKIEIKNWMEEMDRLDKVLDGPCGSITKQRMVAGCNQMGDWLKRFAHYINGLTEEEYQLTIGILGQEEG